MQGRTRTTTLALVALTWAGCGSDPVAPPKVPTAAELRTYWGLNPGSCWVYKDLSGQSAGLTVSVDGPDTVRIAGRTTYIVTQAFSSGGRPNELLLDVDAEAGKMFLARATKGTTNPATTETYIADPRPLFGELEYDSKGALSFIPESVIESASTPQGTTVAVAHKWTVGARDKALLIPSGATTGMELRYFKNGTREAVYDLVPNFGMAHLQLDGVDYQVCQARVCDAANVCTGVDSCAGVVCP